jgi:DNA-binding HxlR family transcriptional regulator
MHTSGCPLAFALDIFGDRWSFLILREMMLRGKKTYSEFLEIDEGIATNILADRLKHLETDGLIRKTRDPENRRSFIYTLTDKGRDLAPVIIEMILWSGKHDQRRSALRATVEKISKDRRSFEADIRSR